MANDTVAFRGPDGRMWLNIDTNKTLVAADSGLVQNVIADGITITVPATVVGHCYTVRNGGAPVTSGPKGSGANGTALVTVHPTGTDGFTGNAVTAAASKGVVNTKATSQAGDEVTVIGTGVNSAVAWVLTNVRGVWAREA